MPAEQLPVQLPCDVAAKGCIAGMDDLRVIVQFDENFGALKPFQLRLQMDPKTTIQIDEINLVFSMAEMNMGLNKYSLIRESDELWIANVTLPICTSGRSDWLADFEITASNQFGKCRFPSFSVRQSSLFRIRNYLSDYDDVYTKVDHLLVYNLRHSF